MYIFATEKMNARMMMFLRRKNKKITIRNGGYVYVYYKISSSPTFRSSSDCICVVSLEDISEEIPVKDFNGDCEDITWNDMPAAWQNGGELGCTLKCHEE